MAAYKTSDLVLSCIKASNLNYTIQESPFSVLINMRKTFVKDKNGEPFFGENLLDFYAANRKLREENEALESKVNNLEFECEGYVKVIHEQGLIIEKAKNELSETLYKVNENAKIYEKELKKKETEIVNLNETKTMLGLESENLKL